MGIPPSTPDSNPVSSPSSPQPGRHRRDWRLLLPGFFAAGAVGLAINQLTSDFGYPAVAVAFAAAGLAWVVVYLRGTHQQAPLRRYASYILAALAVNALLAAVFTPWPWSAWATIAAALLTVTLVLLPTDHDTALRILLSAAAIAGGVALTSRAVVVCTCTGDFLLGVPGIGVGGAFIGLGIAVLLNRKSLVIVTSMGVGGVAFAGIGLSSLRDGDALSGVAAISAGVLLVGTGFGALLRRSFLMWVAGLGAGAASLGLAADALLEGKVLLGVAGFVAIGAAVASLLGKQVLVNTAIIAGGVAAIGLAVDSLLKGGVLFGVAALGAGMAIIGTFWFDGGVRPWIRTRWDAALTPPTDTDPSTPPVPDTPKSGTTAS